jgi:hypothetical protein
MKNYEFKVVDGFEQRKNLACVFARGKIGSESFEASFIWPENNKTPKWVLDFSTNLDSDMSHEIQPELFFELEKVVQDSFKT